MVPHPRPASGGANDVATILNGGLTLATVRASARVLTSLTFLRSCGTLEATERLRPN
jgi:hypothetical protein